MNLSRVATALPRRRLFVRVYLSFLAAMIAASIAFWAVSAAIGRDPLAVRWNVLSGGSLEIAAQTVAERYVRYGSAIASADLAEISRATHVQTALFDASGAAVAGIRPVPPDLIRLNHDAIAGRSVFVPASLAGVYSVREPASGKIFVLVACIPGGLASNLLSPALRIAVTMGIAALICYMVTRSVTAPILALRRGAHRLASGDLAARVRDELELRGRADEIAELGWDFDTMAARLEAAMRAQRRLLADISHELRSRLARRGVAHALAQQSGHSETYLDRIEREAGRMNELIEELLTLARLDGGDSENPLSTLAFSAPIDLARLLAEIVEDARFEAHSKNCDCRLLCDYDSPLILPNGDPELLRRAVENVVRNAVRYSPDGEVVAVSLQKTSDGEFARIIVQDHGPGVPDEALPYLFRPFWRASESRERSTGGTGLGLAIAERAVRAHGGDIHAENVSSGEGGLRVTITLPL